MDENEILFALSPQKLILFTLFFKFLFENNLKEPFEIKEIQNNLLSIFLYKKSDNLIKEELNKIEKKSVVVESNSSIKEENVELDSPNLKKTKLDETIQTNNVKILNDLIKQLKQTLKKEELDSICYQIKNIPSFANCDVEILENLHQLLKSQKKNVIGFEKDSSSKEILGFCLKKLTNRIGIIKRNKK